MWPDGVRKDGDVTRIGYEHGHRVVDPLENFGQLERGRAVGDDRAQTRALDHRPGSLNRERPVQGDVAMPSEQARKHTCKCGLGPVGEDPGEARPVLRRLLVKRRRKSAGLIAQTRVADLRAVDAQSGTIGKRSCRSKKSRMEFCPVRPVQHRRPQNAWNRLYPQHPKVEAKTSPTLALRAPMVR